MNWINIEDRLPEEKKYVLINIPNDHLRIGYLLNKKFIEQAEKITFLENVSHWQELPNRPLSQIPFLDARIDDEEMSIRLKNILKANEIEIFRDLMFYRDYQILQWRNMGKKSFAELKRIYLKHGIYLDEHWKSLQGKRIKI